MYQTSNKELFQKYLNPVFIETGTYYGDGVREALLAGFETIYSIELSKELWEYCLNRYKDYPNVHLVFGDSHLVLDELLNKINEPVTFWLDGHYAGEGTTMGQFESPLLQELEAIGRHHIKTHILLIDDLRNWSVAVQGFDTEIIIRKCLEVNPDYKFTYENGYVPNDILVARV